MNKGYILSLKYSYLCTLKMPKNNDQLNGNVLPLVVRLRSLPLTLLKRNLLFFFFF